MTGGSANRLMAFAEKDAIIRVEDCLSPSFALPSLTKPAMIAVIVPNCLMAGKWMIIVARPIVLLRAERRNLTGAARHSVRSQEKRPKDSAQPGRTKVRIEKSTEQDVVLIIAPTIYRVLRILRLDSTRTLLKFIPLSV